MSINWYKDSINLLTDMEQDTEKTTVLINCPIYAAEGVPEKSQIKITKIGSKLLQKGVQVEHERGSPFWLSTDVMGVVNICKFTKDDILHYRKWVPILYIDIWHTQAGSMTLLFQLFFHFRFDSLVTEEQFLSGESLDGKFMMEVVIDDEKKQFDSSITVFKGCQETIDNLVLFLNNDVMKNYIKDMIAENKARKKNEQKEALANMIQVPKATYSLRPYVKK